MIKPEKIKGTIYPKKLSWGYLVLKLKKILNLV